MKENLASGIMFVKENMPLLNKYYDKVTEGIEGALPRKLCGLPECFNIDDGMKEIDVGQELFADDFE